MMEFIQRSVLIMPSRVDNVVDEENHQTGSVRRGLRVMV